MLLGYRTVSIGKYIPTFRWTFLPPYSGYEQLKKEKGRFVYYLFKYAFNFWNYKASNGEIIIEE